MSVSEYLSVFVSIVLGLALAELATSFHRLMRARGRVRWDWMSLALALVMLFEILQFWWLSFEWFSSLPGLRIIEFVPPLIQFLLIYLLAAAVLPDAVPDEGLDLRHFYRESSRYFWSLVLLLTIAIIVFRGPRPGEPNDWLSIAGRQRINLGIVATASLLLFVRQIRLHQAAVIALLGVVAWLYLGGTHALR